MPPFDPNDYIFFWGGIFSNFHPICGNVHLTSEHFYMELKAIFCKDVGSLLKIRQATTPREAKQLGRSVQGFDPKLWDEYKESAMLSAIYMKAELDVEFKNALIQSGNKILVEASPTDKIWGIGMAANDPQISNTKIWGQNLLGKCLMTLRREFQKKEK